jgi:hypothetical protein
MLDDLIAPASLEGVVVVYICVEILCCVCLSAVRTTCAARVVQWVGFFSPSDRAFSPYTCRHRSETRSPRHEKSAADATLDRRRPRGRCLWDAQARCPRPSLSSPRPCSCPSLTPILSDGSQRSDLRRIGRWWCGTRSAVRATPHEPRDTGAT